MDNRYLYAAARTKTLETEFLDKNHIQQMLSASSPEAAMGVLSSTVYGVWINSLEGYRDYERMLLWELKKTKDYMEKNMPEQKWLTFLYSKYDAHNLKMMFKNTLLEKPNDGCFSELGNLTLEALKLQFAEKTFMGLDKNLKEGALGLVNTQGEGLNPKAIDVTLDRGLYKDLAAITEKSSSDLLKKWLRTQIDLINIETYLRIKNAHGGVSQIKEGLLENGYIAPAVFEKSFNEPLEHLQEKWIVYGYDQLLKRVFVGTRAEEKLGFTDEGANALMGFEKIAEAHLYRLMEEAMYISFGPESLVRYALLKENETKMIRLIMTGKINAISGESIKERLSVAYA